MVSTNVWNWKMPIRERIIKFRKEPYPMNHEPLTLYKLIILYMLDHVDFPLTSAQVSDFLLEKEYTNFLTLQQAISELTDASLITTHSIGNRTHLMITVEGKNTLSFFEDNIGETIKKEILNYLGLNEAALRNEVSVTGEYYKSTSGEYEARLAAREKNVKLIEITLSVPTRESAAAICDNWQRKNQEIYQFLVGQLF